MPKTVVEGMTLHHRDIENFVDLGTNAIRGYLFGDFPNYPVLVASAVFTLLHC